MSMKVAVVGGTGAVGALVVDDLVERGDEVRVLSRRSRGGMPAGVSHRPIDLETGEGLIDGVAGMDAVVDASNDLRRAEAVLAEGTRRLLEAEAAASVGHHVAISIVGCDRTPLPYYGVKVAQEEAVVGGSVPWSILRATQFHTLVAGLFASASRVRIAPTVSIELQPIDPAVVAHRIVEVVHSEPGGRLPDIAGPRVQSLTELSRAWRERAGRMLLPVPVPIPGKLGRALRSGSLCNPDAAVEGPTFGEWLASGSGSGLGGAP
jgi:uncharacterized protein YbjT (DUF2867 family)